MTLRAKLGSRSSGMAMSTWPVNVNPPFSEESVRLPAAFLGALGTILVVARRAIVKDVGRFARQRKRRLVPR